MFTLVDTLEFTHTIPVMVPVDGGFKEQSLKVRFRLHQDDAENAADLAKSDGMEAFLKRVIVSIDDVIDEAKKAMPYSDELRDQLISMSFVKIAMWNGYFAAVTKAKAGN